MKASTAPEILALADEVLARKDRASSAYWARSVTVLLRQALEQSLAELWAARRIPMTGVSFHAQLLCLPTMLDNQQFARSVAQIWDVLSAGVHHHPYEPPPGLAQLTAWRATVAESITALGHAATTRDDVEEGRQ